MRKVIEWLKSNGEHWAHWATVLAFILGGYFAHEQLELVNEQRKWQNYNEMNVRYADLYKSITPEIASGCRPEDFEKLSPDTKRWVRQYFDLHSEEYWLFLNNLIPEEMWTRRIHGGVRVNLNKYPVLVEGFHYWKAEGAFAHPGDFQAEVERAIADAKNLPQKTKQADSCVP